MTAAGAPFWRLVETLDDAPAAVLEAALDAAGLLQSWVTPDGVYLAGRDGNETVWVLRRPDTIASGTPRFAMCSVPPMTPENWPLLVNRLLARGQRTATDVSAAPGMQ